MCHYVNALGAVVQALAQRQEAPPPDGTGPNELVEAGAMRDPFETNRPAMRPFARFGAVNGEELNPNLHAALMLTDLLVPCFASAGAPWETLSIFYGLMQVFPLKNYFGIDYDKEIKFAK